jgi:hypothetical protein
MAKRFTDTNKYKKPFVRGLQGAYKLLWDYLYHDCDHAGIWIVDFEIAQLYLGSDVPVNKQDALKFFNDGEIRIIEVENGTKWFIKPFIEFQYGKLNENNRVHSSIIQVLNKIDKGLIRSLQGRKDKDKDKEKDKEEDKEENNFQFSEFYDNEISIDQDPDYLTFVNFLFGKNGIDPKCVKVLSLKDQLTCKQFKKLQEVAKVKNKGLMDTVRQLENKKSINYASVYLTLNNWLKNEFKPTVTKF